MVHFFFSSKYKQKMYLACFLLLCSIFSGFSIFSSIVNHDFLVLHGFEFTLASSRNIVYTYPLLPPYPPDFFLQIKAFFFSQCVITFLQDSKGFFGRAWNGLFHWKKKVVLASFLARLRLFFVSKPIDIFPFLPHTWMDAKSLEKSCLLFSSFQCVFSRRSGNFSKEKNQALLIFNAIFCAVAVLSFSIIKRVS